MRTRPSFKLRPMRRDDLGQVHHLDELIFPTPWSLNSYKFELEQNVASHQWVIETETQDGAEVIAFVVCWYLGDEVHIANLAVSPHYRRMQLGRTLLAYALTQASQAGMHSATLEVRAGNTAAQALYASFSFQVVATRRAYYQDNREDALLMQLFHLTASHPNAALVLDIS